MVVHLNVESRFGTGSAPVEALVERAALFGMEALALTDRAGMGGAIAFYQASRKFGVRPILGTQLPVDGHWLSLLAQDLGGYQNLCRLVTAHHQQGVSWDGLRSHAGGVAVLAGEAVWELLQVGKAREALHVVQQLPANSRLAIHSQLSGRVRSDLTALAAQTGLPLVMAHPVRHLSREDVPLGGMTYLKSPREMQALGPHWRQAIAEAKRLADSCQVDLPSRVGAGCVRARVGVWTARGLVPHPELMAAGPLADWVPLIPLEEGGWVTMYDDPSLRRLGIALSDAQGSRQLSLPRLQRPQVALGQAG